MWKTVDLKFKYKIIKNLLSKEICDFLFKYWLVQEQAVKHLLDTQQTYKHNIFIGTFELDEQVVGHYSKYGDWSTDTILEDVRPKIEKELNCGLISTYSYTRVYRKGAELVRHTDRKSCNISATLNLGGDMWPIFLDITGKNNIKDTWYDKTKGHKIILKKNAPKGIKIELNQGDALFYIGDKYEHWREPFTGNVCLQTFLHYNLDNKENKNNKFDGRLFLGIPKFLDD
jgi:hypothetical protein